MMPATPRDVSMVAFVVLFIGLVVWISVAELDYGVHAFGKVANRHANILIQHNATARVAGVAVVEGQAVSAGQLLLTLEDADAVAEGGRAETQRLILYLQHAALLAERRSSVDLPLPVAQLPVLSADVVVRAHAEATQALRQRIASHQAQLAQFEGDLRSLAQQVQGIGAELMRIGEQATILRNRIAALSPLLTEGLMARSAVEDLRMRLADLERDRAASQSERVRQQALIEQIESRRRIYLADREREMRTLLSELEPQISAMEQAVAAVAVRLRSQQIVAASTGQVVNVKVKAGGEVVAPGTVMMELVPLERSYFVEARILPAEIENVRPGMPAEVRFVTLPSKATPYVDGKLISVSANAIVDEQTREETYIATVDFTANVVKAIGMEPTLGMPVEVMLKGGRRSVMSYLIEPFRVLFSRAMREV